MITISNVEHFKEEIKSITNNINHNLYLINSEQLYFISAFIKIFKEKLPDELKASLISLAIWVSKETNRVMDHLADLDGLISINRQVMAGLAPKD